MIDPKADTAVDDAALIAEALVIPAHGEGRHFSDAARNFLRGLILYVCANEPPERRNLLRIDAGRWNAYQDASVHGTAESLLVSRKVRRPGKGNDKGKVEGLVGYARRNFLVPVPRTGSWEELNEKLRGQFAQR